MLKIAIPMDEKQTIYHNNPYTAPQFAIYEIVFHKGYVHFNLNQTIQSPWNSVFKEKTLKCSCDASDKNDIRHICEHYSLLEVLKDCKYLLADHFCENTSKVLEKANITIFKIPSIINRADLAIKNFLIGASFANNLQKIYNVS